MTPTTTAAIALDFEFPPEGMDHREWINQRRENLKNKTTGRARPHRNFFDESVGVVKVRPAFRKGAFSR